MIVPANRFARDAAIRGQCTSQCYPSARGTSWTSGLARATLPCKSSTSSATPALAHKPIRKRDLYGDVDLHPPMVSVSRGGCGLSIADQHRKNIPLQINVTSPGCRARRSKSWSCWHAGHSTSGMKKISGWCRYRVLGIVMNLHSSPGGESGTCDKAEPVAGASDEIFFAVLSLARDHHSSQKFSCYQRLCALSSSIQLGSTCLFK